MQMFFYDGDNDDDARARKETIYDLTIVAASRQPITLCAVFSNSAHMDIEFHGK